MNEAYKAVADETRREILRLLREEDLTAGQIQAQFEISWPSITHHLNILRQAGLIQVEPRGQQRVYSLNTTVLQEFLARVLELLGEERDDD